MAQSGLPKEEVEWALWKSAIIGELLALAPTRPTIEKANVAQSLCYCINQAAAGSIVQFASEFRLDYSHLCGWLRGEKVPNLVAVLLICFKMKVSALDFLSGCLYDPGQSGINLVGRNRPNRKSEVRNNSKRYSPDELENLLNEALKQVPPPTLCSLAQIAGWSAPGVAARFPDLCAALILLRYGESYHKLPDNDTILSIIEPALTEVPPPSLLKVANRVGKDAGLISRRFPELTKVIISRYKSYRYREADLKRIKPRLKKALTQEPPPSLRQLSRSLGFAAPVVNRRFPALSTAIKRRYAEYVRRKREEAEEVARSEIKAAVTEMLSEGHQPTQASLVRRFKGRISLMWLLRLIPETIRDVNTATS